ncbi:AI-2E family transporter [Conexibacter sp. DBS9H8]|uniref:AI-2E family transporter n=1 Tax=Conexibacter sp. DBS9H8 TaxID=2937801 RepID=UPI00200D3DDC|nr:AI-2E family transporter [Conexibacter sp. DBS9H8]
MATRLPDPSLTGPPAGRAGEPAAPERDSADPTAAVGDPVAAADDPAGLVPHPAPGVERVIVPRWIQAVLLPLALLGLYALARASGPVVPIIVIAAVIALILNPLVKRFSRRMPRGLAIAAAYLSVLVLFAVIAVIIFNPVAGEINHFANNVPALTKKANRELNAIQTWLDHRGIKVHLRRQGQTALDTLQKQVLKQSNSIVSFSKSVLTTLFTLSIDGLLTLVLSIYLLVYARPIGELVRRVMPPGSGTAADDFPLLVQRALTGYVRGQLLFTLIMGASVAAVMWLFGTLGIFPDGARFALFFGAFYGLMEFVPYVGPIIGAIPPLAVALFSDPLSALWVLIVFIVLQQLEGHLVAPQVFRISLRINPILVIVALLVGDQLWGIAGALVALPVATVIRQTALYLRDHLALEPWARLPPAPPR